MAKQLGTVTALSGDVIATNTNDSRTLRIQDPIFDDDVIITGEDGLVEIGLANNQTIDLGRNSEVSLKSLIDDASFSETVEESTSADVEAIQQALLEGGDPTVNEEATAAGAGVQTGNEGHEAVFVDYLNPEVTPEAGFDTTGVTNQYSFPEEDIIVTEQEGNDPVNQPDNDVPVENQPPTLIVNEGQTGLLFEAGLPSGSNVGKTIHTMTGSFSLFDPDGVDDITHVKINSTTIDIDDLGSDNLIQGQYGQLIIIDYDSETGKAIFEYHLTNPAVDIENTDEKDFFSLAVSDDGINFSSPVAVAFQVIDDSPVFRVVNDDADTGTLVSVTAYNSEPDQMVYDDIQLADWVLGADGFENAAVTIPDGVNAEVVSQSQDSIIINFFDGEEVAATLTLNADGHDNLQVFNRDYDTQTIPLLTKSATASGPELVKYINTEDLNVAITGSDGDSVANEPQDEVNPSNRGWAVDDNQIDVSESITFTFDRPVGNFSFVANGFTGGPSEGNVGLNITVYYDQAMTDYETFQVSAESNQLIHIDELNGFGSNLTGSSSFWAVDVESDSSAQDHNDGFRLNDISVTTTLQTVPGDLEYHGITVEIEDTDGDSASQSFDLVLKGEYGSELSLEAITGTSSDDVLMGTSGDDVIKSGSGDDTITTGDGNDHLVWDAGESGTDTLTDFEQGSDVIDISQLLDPEGALDIGGVHSLDDYLKASFDGTHTTFEVYNNGDAAQDTATATQTIVVAGDFTDLSTLIIDGDLVVEQS
ncbi:retention module-containing protein [Methylophaga sp.]|jgi:hypothetical protein|uniref:retention module-containing protein n=1 Tax=Methylophaga sp. TaxID=2024840 RepID=UPI0013FEEBE1|nr:retention module-containing protein [Methylophaga sp.]MTI63533.1 retention module-containing protein [Methylophaga sp.]